MAWNSPLNQPLTTLMPMRPPEMWSMVAICLATTAGFHGPGRMAASTFSRVVACSRAWLNDTDSCWCSAP